MTVTLLADNDVVIKLAQMDAYVDAMASMGFSPQQVGSLPVMLRYMGIADSNRRSRLTANAAEADRLNAVLQSIVKIEMTADEASTAAMVMKAALLADLDVQEGELALCVVAVFRGDLDVCTGDKRALRELPALEQQWAALGGLRGRLLCFEQFFKMLCTQRGIARIRKAVTMSPRADETISFVYDKTSEGGDRGFIKGIELVINEHIAKPAPGWLKSV